MSWLAWDHVCTPKSLGGESILNFLCACSGFLEMVAYFIKKTGIQLENMMVKLMVEIH